MKQGRLVAVCERAFGSRGIQIAIGLIKLPWMKIVDSAMTMSCLVGVVLLTRSMGAFLIVVAFGLWNYYRGLTDGDERDSKSKMPAALGEAVITRSMIDRVKSMPPGGAIRCICEKEQVEFIVIEASDFDHIVDLAGMVAKDKPAE